MNKINRILAYVAGAISLVILGLYIFVRVYVGAVNFPLGGDPFDPTVVGHKIQVAKGFSIGVYAEGLENARALRFTRTGDLLVATPNLDKIEILRRDANHDGKADGRETLIEGLNGPNGMDFYQGWLYIAETDAIGRIAFDHETGSLSGDYERLVTGLPGGENHWKKTLRFGPDGFMYVTMGSSCNACIEEDERRATMMRYTPDGKNETIFARGLRNSAGFDWSPRDGEIYATDNGRDSLGDNFPPCELNKVQADRHYGWPYANGDKLKDPDFGEGQQDLIESSIAPAFNFKAHNAPLGITFIRGDKVPEHYRQSAIVALHGSWNRSEKDGYKVVSLHWDQEGKITEKDFVTGFLENDTVIGRPAEVLEGPDGAIYISDDFANVIYRVAYNEVQSLDTLTLKKTFNAEQSLARLDDIEREDLLSQGRSLFNANQCVSCHADDGEGLKKLEKLGEKYDLEALANFIRRPNSPMPIYPFSEAQRKALAVYLIAGYPGS